MDNDDALDMFAENFDKESSTKEGSSKGKEEPKAEQKENNSSSKTGKCNTCTFKVYNKSFSNWN